MSMESIINNPVMEIHDMNSLATHHHLCTFSFFPQTPWQTLPQTNSTRQHWKLQRLSDPEVRQLYIQNFDDKTESISQFLDRSFNSSHSIVHEPTIEQVSHDLISAIYTSLDNSVTRKKARPKSWNKHWNNELQQKADDRKRAYGQWRQAPRDNMVQGAKLWSNFIQKSEEFSKALSHTRRLTWKQFCTKLGNAPPNEANTAIKRMRHNRRPVHQFSHPDGPKQASETMVSHLSVVFGGERQEPHSTTRSGKFPLQKYIDHDTNYDPFPFEEIAFYISKMAPRKAPGNDHITGTMLKPIAHRLSIVLSKFFKLCWYWSYIPMAWRTAQVIPIFKKGDPTVASNYHLISLTSQHDEPLIQAYLDIRSTYDAVDRDIIWSILQKNLTSALFHLVRHMFDDIQIAVVLQNCQSRYIYPKRGVLQGSILSPLLYAVFIDTLPCRLRINMFIRCNHALYLQSTFIKGSTEASAQQHRSTNASTGQSRNTHLRRSNTIISALLYADDVALLGSRQDMHRLLKIAEKHSNELGFQWHPDKCAIIEPPTSTASTYKLYGKPIPKVQQFQYLGIPFDFNGINSDQLVNQRITKATGNMELLRQMGIHQYSVGLWPAIRVYRTFVRPVLEYGLAITALSAKQKDKLNNAQKSCIKMALNRNRSTPFPTIVPLALADLPSMQTRTCILQLKFVTRLQDLPLSTIARSIELSFLKGKSCNKQWKHFTSNNPFYQLYNKLKNANNPLSKTINQKRDEEFQTHTKNRKTIRCLCQKRMIDPILYLPAFPWDRHCLIKWRMHWLPSYPLKNCRCGVIAAKREHYDSCPLLFTLLNDLKNAFGDIPTLPQEQQPLDYILNHLPRSEVGLTLGTWQTVWPALIRVIPEIDYLSHPNDDFDMDEPAPEDAMDIPISSPTQSLHLN
ncbi:hypothetical protein INT45_011524 [Circinella minor]|uniref:Reverse transcriptase domain-containing protein n=1 Tax=Circinella minor TaxID=1195481 RepID=A0A8H7VNP9_9FUNG|nr:hypothetical protein INT45_011524 [Circinella minor]